MESSARSRISESWCWSWFIPTNDEQIKWFFSSQWSSSPSSSSSSSWVSAELPRKHRYWFYFLINPPNTHAIRLSTEAWRFVGLKNESGKLQRMRAVALSDQIKAWKVCPVSEFYAADALGSWKDESRFETIMAANTLGTFSGHESMGYRIWNLEL